MREPQSGPGGDLPSPSPPAAPRQACLHPRSDSQHPVVIIHCTSVPRLHILVIFHLKLNFPFKMKTRNDSFGVENDFSFQYWEYEYYCIVKNESIKEFGWELCRFSLFRPFYTIRYHIILQIYRRYKIVIYLVKNV